MSIWKRRQPGLPKTLDDACYRFEEPKSSANYAAPRGSDSDAALRAEPTPAIRACEPDPPAAPPVRARRRGPVGGADAIAPQRLMTKQAAAYLGLSARTLERWRVEGTGPQFHKLGPGRRSRVVYLLGDLDAWVEEQAYRSTSEY